MNSKICSSNSPATQCTPVRRKHTSSRLSDYSFVKERSQTTAAKQLAADLYSHKKLFELQRGGRCYRLFSRCQSITGETNSSNTLPIQTEPSYRLKGPTGFSSVQIVSCCLTQRAAKAVSKLPQFNHHGRPCRRKGVTGGIIRLRTL